MRFSVYVKSIQAPIAKISSICSPNLDIIHFKLENGRLTLTGTNGKSQLKAEIPLESIGADEFYVSANKIQSLVKSLDSGEVVAFDTSDSENVIIETNQGEFKIGKISSSSIPIFDDSNTATGFEVSGKQLKELLAKSIFCVSRENFREYLKGVRFEVADRNLTIFTLDGYRMACLETKLDMPCIGKIEASIPLECAKELGRLLVKNSSKKVTIRFDNKIAVMRVGQYELTSKLLTCNYPNVRAVLSNETQTEVRVDKDALKASVKRLSGFVNKRLKSICFTFSNGKLKLSASNIENDMAHAEIDCDYNLPEDRQVNLNAFFVADCLSAIDTPKVVFGFTPPYSTTQIHPDGDREIKARYVIAHVVV